MKVGRLVANGEVSGKMEDFLTQKSIKSKTAMNIPMGRSRILEPRKGPPMTPLPNGLSQSEKVGR